MTRDESEEEKINVESSFRFTNLLSLFTQNQLEKKSKKILRKKLGYKKNSWIFICVSKKMGER